jgi:NADH-quinone oxidoreductase subunit A
VVSQGIPEETGYIIFLFAATLLLVLALRLVISPRDPRPTPEKKAPFESGQIAAGPGRTRFIIQYYPYILMFVVYDVIAMFLFAWALDLRALGATGTIPVLVFMIVALVPLAYALHLAGQRENW